MPVRDDVFGLGDIFAKFQVPGANADFLGNFPAPISV
jgi:hypothetical protein